MGSPLTQLLLGSEYEAMSVFSPHSHQQRPYGMLGAFLPTSDGTRPVSATDEGAPVGLRYAGALKYPVESAYVDAAVVGDERWLFARLKSPKDLAVLGGGGNPSLMALDKPYGLALDPPSAWLGSCGDLCPRLASAPTVAVGNGGVLFPPGAVFGGWSRRRTHMGLILDQANGLRVHGDLQGVGAEGGCKLIHRRQERAVPALKKVP